MKVSLNWLKEFTDIKFPVDELVLKIGAQLGAVEEVVDWGKQYDGVVVARIESCEKHPNADKLSICLIDDGGAVENVERDESGYIQVVCGAPNVREGLIVAWIPPGATVPSTYNKQPLILGARELRGVISNGMLASGQELRLNDNHNGILEINPEEVGQELAKPGTPFKNLYGLDDVIIDIENKMFTHRPDCFGVLGVAREIAGIQQQPFQSPDWYLNHPTFAQKDDLPLTVNNEISELVPRFMAVAMKEVEVKPSPLWLQAGLARIGIKSINNIVDVTNYLMYVTGQPLHAYDYDKVAARSNNGAVLTARLPNESETVKLLSGKILKPHPKTIMIATDKELIGVGGVMGGADTEVDENTKNIIIECANFDMYSIRRTSMAHGLFTDAVTRFNKGQSPLQNSRIVARAMQLMSDLASAKQASNVTDLVNCDAINIADDGWVDKEVTLTAEFINERLGLNLADTEILQLLKNVEFGFDYKDQTMKIYAPFWRTDIAIPEDIVEEVGRLYGFEKLPLKLPRRTTSPTHQDKSLDLKQKLRTKLASFGSSEVLTYSFVHGDLIEKAGQNKDFAFKLSNALSPDLQYYRMTLTPSLLAKVHTNIKAGHSAFSLFEINKTHINLHKNDDNDVPKELEMIALVIASKSAAGAAYFQARVYLDQLARSLGIRLLYEAITERPDYQVTAPFEHTRAAVVKIASTGDTLGIVGEYTKATTKALKLPAHCAGFEIGLDTLMEIEPQAKYATLSRYPGVSQDICLEVNSDKDYGVIAKSFEEVLQAQVGQNQIANWWPIDIYATSGSDKKRFTFSVKLTSYECTLTDKAVNVVLEDVAAVMSDSVGAQRI